MLFRSQLGGDCGQFVTEYLVARSNPQRAARDVAALIANHMATQRVQWLVIDDYHELSPSPEVEELVEVLHEHSTARFLVSSRLRPSWATSRRVLYREIDWVTRELLAMDLMESKQVLGSRPELQDLIGYRMTRRNVGHFDARDPSYLLGEGA